MAITYGHLGLAEPSTVTNVVATVVVARGSTNEHQEILVLGDPQSSIGMARVLASSAASTEYGMVVRPVLSTNAVENPVGATLQANALASFAPTNATSSNFEASRVIKASSGVLYELSGYSNSSVQQFIQLHDATAVPANGAVPIIPVVVPSFSNFSVSYGVYGRLFSAGIVVCNSTSAGTKAIGSTDCWFDAQYK